MVGVPSKWTDDGLREAVAASTSWRGVTRMLGIAGGGGSYRAVQRGTERLGLDTAHFRGNAWNKGMGKGRDPQLQRDAKRRWYENNRQVYRERNNKNRKARAAEVNRLKEVPCSDCGREYPAFAMDFDHREGETKRFNISTARHSKTMRQLLPEIAKCDVVCAVCHRFRTARRAGWSEGQALNPETALSIAEDE